LVVEAPEPTLLSFEASRSVGKVSGILLRPVNAGTLLVFAHGAGAGMKHPFMERMSRKLAEKGIATFRYQFPYIERKSKRPDPKPLLLATVRSAVAKALEQVPELPLIAGGKSMGGRMTSMAAGDSTLPGVRGLVFFGFPLHPPGTRSTERAEHLQSVQLPMLFLQGTRDTFAELTLLQPVCAMLGDRARLHIIEGADHSFHVPKSSGKNDEQVMSELASTVAEWGRSLR
jgi:hypothetical protein